MAAAIDSVLFDWRDVEQFPQLHKLKLVLDVIPYQGLTEELARRRGKGRNDYPVEPMFRLLVAGIIFQHSSAAECLRNLKSNPHLAELCGFSPLPFQQRPRLTVGENPQGGWEVDEECFALRHSLPDETAFSRFMRNLLKMLEKHDWIEDMFIQLRDEVKELLPDYGVRMGFDGKRVESHSTGRKKRRTGETSDPDADWGRHEIYGTDKDGNAWSEVKKWFGYRFLVIADTVHELPVSYSIVPASFSEQPQLRRMLRELKEGDPGIAERCGEFCADRGLDGNRIYEIIYDGFNASPIIENREMWRAEKKDGNHDPDQPILRMVNGGDRPDNILHSESGGVYCMCPASGELRDMYFYGIERKRNTLKYRCPARVYELDCEGFDACLKYGESSAFSYGRVVRIKLDSKKLRTFCDRPRHTRRWQESYNLRNAMERVFSRVSSGYMFERHFIRGIVKMRAKAGLSMVIMLALAIVRIRCGEPQLMRSLVKPVGKALEYG